MGSGNLVNGIIGQGIRFDGVDDIIDCGSDGSLDISDLTIELWGYYDSTYMDGGVWLAGRAAPTR